MSDNKIRAPQFTPSAAGSAGMDLAAAKAAAAAVAARGKEPAAGGASAGAVAAARAAAAALAARKAAAAPPAAAAPAAAPLLPDAAKQAAAAFAAKHSQPAVPSAGVEAARAAAAAFAKSLPTEKQAAHLAGQAALNPGGGKAQAPGAFVVPDRQHRRPTQRRNRAAFAYSGSGPSRRPCRACRYSGGAISAAPWTI